MFVLLLTTSIVCLLGAVDAEENATVVLQEPPTFNYLTINGIKDVIIKVYRSCGELETMACMKKRTIHMIDILSKERNVPLIGDSLQLVRDAELVNNTFEEREDRSLTDSVTKFLSSYRLQIRLPKLSFLQTSEEGRRKNKGGGGYGVMAMMMGGSLMAMGLAAVAALSGKALAASLAALMLAALAALKKNQHHGHSSYEVITVPSHHHHRSFYEGEEEEQHHHKHIQHHDDGTSSLEHDQQPHYDKPYHYEQHIQTSEIQDHRNVKQNDHLQQHLLHEHAQLQDPSSYERYT